MPNLLFDHIAQFYISDSKCYIQYTLPEHIPLFLSYFLFFFISFLFLYLGICTKPLSHSLPRRVDWLQSPQGQDQDLPHQQDPSATLTFSYLPLASLGHLYFSALYLTPGALFLFSGPRFYTILAPFTSLPRLFCSQSHLAQKQVLSRPSSSNTTPLETKH